MQSINITEATGGWAVEFNLWVADSNVLGSEHSTDCCLGSGLTDVPSQSWRGGWMNENPAHHSWLPNSSFLNATESGILPPPADTAPNASPALSLPFHFSMHAIVSSLFLLLCKSLEPPRLNARDIILLFAGRSVTSVFCSPRKSESSIDVKGSAHRGREISTLEAGSASWMRILL